MQFHYDHPKGRVSLSMSIDLGADFLAVMDMPRSPVGHVEPGDIGQAIRNLIRLRNSTTQIARLKRTAKVGRFTHSAFGSDSGVAVKLPQIDRLVMAGRSEQTVARVADDLLHIFVGARRCRAPVCWEVSYPQ